MARYPIQGTFQDGNGKRIDSGTVSFFLADTTTPASVYAAKSGGAAVNSVASDSAGGFIAYVDDGDYASTQLFDLSLAKTNYITRYIYDTAPIGVQGIATTFTPVLEFGGGVTGITYAVQGGFYTRIGNIVNCCGSFILTSKGSDTGSARITGLPFTSTHDGFNDTPISLRVSTVSFANILQAYVPNSTTYIILEEVLENGTTSLLDNTDFADTSRIAFQVSYFTEG